MKKLSRLLMTTVLVSALAGHALAAPSGETEATGQPFVHPTTDTSYSKDMRDDEMLAKSKSTDNGEVKYVSGGIAESGMRAIDAEQSLYNLKLLFVAEPNGEYLADVSVKIMDGKGRTVLDTTTKGPVLLVNLPHGKYTIDATRASGSKLTQKVEAGEDHLSSYVLRYPANTK